MTENNGPKSLKVWDPVVRIGHWVLVISVLTAYFVGDGSKDIHVIAGYTVAGIVVLRLVWGFIGTRHARFSDFVRGPSAVFGYLTSIFRGGYRRYVGHNPAGGAMIIALLFSLAVTTGSGMALLAIEHQEGPLAPLISSDTSPASQPGMNLQSEENEDDEHDGYAEGAESESEEIFEAIHKVFTYLTLGLAALHVASCDAAVEPRLELFERALLLEIDGVRQVVEWNHRALVGVESTTGRALWEFPFPHVGSNQNMPTPAFYKDRILLSGENRGMVSLQPRQENGAWRVKELWFQKKVALDMSSAIVNDDLLYGFSHYSSGRLFCLEIETGKLLWQGPGRTGDNATFLAIPNHVVALLDNGTLQVVATNRNRLQTVATYRVAKSSTWAPPVLLPGGFLVKDGDSLARWSLPQTAIQATSVRSR